MKTSYLVGIHLGLLTAAGLSGANLLVASQSALVSQAWAVRIEGPANSFFQAAGISVGPSGDVFVAGHARNFGSNRDLLISRRSPNGAQVWEKRYEPDEGPMANEVPFDIVARGTNVYVAAAIRNTDGNQDFLTLKYRDTGTLEWAVRLDGAGHSGDTPVAMAVDGQGNVLVLGNTSGTNGGIDIVVLKYGASGNLLWMYSYDGPEHGGDYAAGIRLDAEDNICVAGTLNQWSSPSAAVTFKLSPGGQQVWLAREVSSDANGITAQGLDLDRDGNVVTVGNEQSYCVTWKYDANGSRQWEARYRAEEPASMYAAGVRLDGDGNIITGANLYGSGTNDAVLIKYTDAGRQLWAARISGPEGVSHLNAFDVDEDGSSYLTMSPVADIVTVKVSPAGAQLWSIPYHSQGLFYDYGEFLELAPTGEILVAGRSVYFSESFVSLVKYGQQPVAGIVTSAVTPAHQVVDPGANVVFTADTCGPGPVQFQWRMNGRVISDATNATLTLSNVQIFHRGDYSVIVSNSVGVTVSPESRLSVRVPPQVSLAPTQSVAYVGTDAAFVATVAGNDFVTLQWRHNGTNIPGATNGTLRLANLNAASGGLYDVVASTFGGTSTSSAAGLQISGAVKVIGTIPHRSAFSTSEYTPQFRVLPTGEFLIAARSNHIAGSSIVLQKHQADGDVLWSAAFESPEFTNAEPSSLALDAAGNIYVAGLSRQPYVPAAWAVLKFNSNGQLLWSRIQTGANLWGSIHTFAVDGNGGSVFGALSQGIMVTRYNSAGDLQWSFDDLSPDNDTIAMAVDSSGNTYLGTTVRVGGYNEIWLRKLDSTGATIWFQPHAEGIHNRLGAIAADSADNLIIAGTGTPPEVADGYMFVAKYSPAGEKLWETRTGSSWSEIVYIVAVSIGPDDEITVLTESDDDYEFGEESGVTRIGASGQFRYRIKEPHILVSKPSQLALDRFGNAYVTGSGSRPGTGADAATAKYDAFGNRLWLVYHDGPVMDSWDYGLGVGADAAGDIRVLASEGFGSGSSADFSVVQYRQRDPGSTFRVQLVPDGGGTFHLGAPVGESFQIEASADLQNWSALSESERQQLLQPGGGFFGSSQRFFRLVFTE